MLNVNTDELNTSQDKQLKLHTDILEKKLIAYGENKNLIQDLAGKHFEEGNYNRALCCYFKLLEFEPRNARFWNKIAVIFIKLERFKTATEFSKIAYRMINGES